MFAVFVERVIGRDIACWARCTIAMAVEFFGLWLTNAYLYPQFVDVLPVAREMSSVTGIVVFISIACIVSRKPSVLDEARISAVSLAAYPLAFGLVCFGLFYADPATLVVGAVLRAASTRWIALLAGVSICSMPARSCMSCIAAAYCLSYCARAVFGDASSIVCTVALFLCPYIVYASCASVASTAVDAAKKEVPRAVSSITQPSAFLPFSHALFAAILIFRVAYGFALTFGSVNGVPVQTLFSLIPLAVVLVFAFLPSMPRADALYQVAALFVVAGVGVALVASGGGQASLGGVSVAGLLYAGSECFEVLMWFSLASIGARNLSGALVVVAWGRAASSAGLLMGAFAGHAMNASGNPSLVSAGLVVMLVAFVAVNVTVLKGFSFQETIDGIVPLKNVDSKQGDVPLDVMRGCDVLVEEKALTPRESEIVRLLARGRNAPYIQEKLVLSRNTVKTHVANIYAKVGVHSQQDLIDMVEECACKSADGRV
ncbi:MAG: LuxR C-terminal-related transcriptional regulator [Slackia sp.]|nr:LuxR C-terminal-related transcriptional regulator [Slackia sp.]